MRRQAGFSLVELTIVVVIGLVVTTAALPNMLTIIANTRIRSSMSTLNGIFQNCRMMAVKTNRMMTTHFTPPSSGGIMAYIKLATDTSPAVRTDVQVELEKPIVAFTTPSGTNAPVAIADATLGYTPQTGDVSFNSRGLPCANLGLTCPNNGFVYYFKDTRRTGNSGWAAVSISPAGRIKKWFWGGTAWGE